MALDQPVELPMTSDDAGLTREVYALLAQANLLRMRGSWEEAVQNCMAALSLAPEHSSAQSLLGDIYENQGRHDDAIQWYHMALDVNPDSPADRLKLDRLLQMRQEEPRRSRFQQITGLRSPVAPHPRRSRFTNPETALRAASLFAALAVLLIVGSAYVAIHRHAALASLGLASDQEVKTPTVVVPTENDPASSRSFGAHDASEQGLLDALRASGDLSGQGVTVYDVQIDPRSLALDITFGLAPGASGSLSRDSVLRAALRVLQLAASLPGGQSTGSSTVRCLQTTTAAGSANSATLIFVANAAAGALPADAPSAAGLTTAQLQALFTNSWWSTQITG